jgi:hypothetical protein
VSVGVGVGGRTFEIAEVRVGLGALFLAPKRRFMVGGCLVGLSSVRFGGLVVEVQEKMRN